MHIVLVNAALDVCKTLAQNLVHPGHEFLAEKADTIHIVSTAGDAMLYSLYDIRDSPGVGSLCCGA